MAVLQRFETLGVQGRLFLGIVPLAVLMALVAVIVHLGFRTVGASARDLERVAQLLKGVETLETCFSGAQRALLQYMISRSQDDSSAFQSYTNCMQATAGDVAPELLDYIDRYLQDFQRVVAYSKAEADLRGKAIEYGPLARQTLLSIITKEARDGVGPAIFPALIMKNKIAQSLFQLDAFLSSRTDTSRWDALDLANQALEQSFALQTNLTSPLQKRRAETTIALIENYAARALDAKRAIAKRSRLEQQMLTVTAPAVTEVIARNVSAMRARHDRKTGLIGFTLMQTHQRVLALASCAIILAALLVVMLGRSVSRSVRAMASLMARIAGGEYEIVVPGTQWRNELGDMARSLRTFQCNALMRIQAEVEVTAARKAAQTDVVTGFGNRRAIDLQVAALADEPGAIGASSLALIDLNAFKPINDNYGHDAGDYVLKAVAQRLHDAFHDTGFVARLGGDEFGVLLRNISSQEALEAAGTQLVALFEEPVVYNDEPLRIGACVGIARLRDVDGDSETGWKAADRAMFSIKTRRINGYALFDADQTIPAEDQIPASRIERAIQEGEIEPFFQPKFDLVSGKILGLESLARWRNPELGILAPAQFLDAVEKFGLIGNFTQHMATETFDAIKTWRDAGLTPPPVAINLHEVFVATDGGVDALMFLMESYGIGPADVVFEITEDVLISRSFGDVKRSIERLSAWGSLISLDDFGTGFGSLRNVEELPVGELKIDESFVHRIGVSKESEAIVRCIVNLAQGLELNVVAEGVETEEQAAFLRALGCPMAQGFLEGPAVDREKAKALLISERDTRAA